MRHGRRLKATVQAWGSEVRLQRWVIGKLCQGAPMAQVAGQLGVYETRLREWCRAWGLVWRPARIVEDTRTGRTYYPEPQEEGDRRV